MARPWRLRQNPSKHKTVRVQFDRYRVFVINGTGRKLTETQNRRPMLLSNLVVNANARRGAGKVQLIGHKSMLHTLRSCSGWAMDAVRQHRCRTASE